MNACGHIRCEAKPCQWARPPALESMPPGVDRVNVRAAFVDMMVPAMRADPAWGLHLARLATLDGTR